MTSPVGAIGIKQQNAKTDINANVWIDDECIAVLHTPRNIVRKITSVDHVEIDLEVFIGRKIVLEKHSKRDKPVSRSTEPTTGNPGAVYRLIVRIECIFRVVIIFYIFFCAHKAETDPAFSIFHQLAKKSCFKASGIGFCIIISIIANPDVLDIIWVYMRHGFIVCFGCPSERTATKSSEIVIKPG